MDPATIPSEFNVTISNQEKVELLDFTLIENFDPDEPSYLYNGQYWVASVNGEVTYLYYDGANTALTPAGSIHIPGTQPEKIVFNEQNMYVFGHNSTNTTDYYITPYTLQWDGTSLTVTEFPFDQAPDFPCGIFKYWSG